MKIQKQAGLAFTPAPAGVHNAVCVDVVDLGMRESFGAMKEQIRIVWQIDEDNPDFKGKYIVMSTYNVSGHPDSNLMKHLESWRGAELDADEFIELEDLIGAPCMLNVTHKKGKTDPTKTYANVTAVMPKAKGVDALKPDGNYTRVKDRDDYVPPGKAEPLGLPPTTGTYPPDDTDLPF